MKRTFLLLTIVMFFCSCNSNRMKITVTNPLPFDRSADMVELPVADITLKIKDCTPAELIVTDSKGKHVPAQLIYNGQPEPASLIFRAQVAANSKSVYYIGKGKPVSETPLAYGRFVPERMDDYAWENDRIAFRIYGPALIAKDGPSNGLDVWIKRTDKMVIDKWYADYLSGKNTYHDDNGEGCDCYKVGRTLGAGAMAPFVNDSLWLGINFESYETLDNGPLRTSFRLKYPPFLVNGTMVSETRTISLDAGSQLTKIIEEYTGLNEEFPVAAGIVESKEGSPLATEANAIAYRLDGGEGGITYVGTILTTPVLSRPEKSGHLLIVTNYIPGSPLTYYTGAGWSKWGFETDKAWTDYLNNYAQRLNGPLKVVIE
ncbi:MAG: DUF4861 domain-containing protein [Bacteroidales bacterium]